MSTVKGAICERRPCIKSTLKTNKRGEQHFATVAVNCRLAVVGELAQLAAHSLDLHPLDTSPPAPFIPLKAAQGCVKQKNPLDLRPRLFPHF